MEDLLLEVKSLRKRIKDLEVGEIAAGADPSLHTHSKLRESDDGADALTSDATANLTVTSGNLTLTSGNVSAPAGYVQADQFYRDRQDAVADDSAINAGGPVSGSSRYLLGIVANGGEYFWGSVTYNGITAFNSSGFAIVAGGGTLTGTDGTDGTINVRDNAGVLYIENRAGANRNIGWVFVAAD